MPVPSQVVQGGFDMKWILTLVLLAPMSALAQSGEITGRVVDPSGGLVARAEIAVTNVDTGSRLQAQSNTEGYFTVSRLDPGRYRVEVKASGFKVAVRSGIALQVEQVARLDFTLEVGAVNEKVEVAGMAPLVESETSSVGQVITNKSIVEIPLNGRNAWDLAKLSGAT